MSTLQETPGVPDDSCVQTYHRSMQVRDLHQLDAEVPAVLPGGDKVSVKLTTRRLCDPGIVALIILSAGGDSFPFMAYPGTILLLPNGQCFVEELRPGMLLYGGATVKDSKPLLVNSMFWQVKSARAVFVRIGKVYVRTVSPQE